MHMKKDGSYRYNLKFACDSEKNIRAGELLEKCGNKKSLLIIEALNDYIDNHPELSHDENEIKIVKVSDNGLPDDWKNIVKEMIEKYSIGHTGSDNVSSVNIQDTNVIDNSLDDSLLEMFNNLDAFVT